MKRKLWEKSAWKDLTFQGLATSSPFISARIEEKWKNPMPNSPNLMTERQHIFLSQSYVKQGDVLYVWIQKR